LSGLSQFPADAWDDLLSRVGCADAYLRRDYVEGATLLDEGEPAFLHLAGPGGDVLFACIVRDLPGSDARDVITPYGYGGPVGVGEEPPLERFYGLYEEWCAERGVVSSFIRFHPLFANHRFAPPAVHLGFEGRTVGWRLDGGRDLLAGMDGKHRNTVRKAMRAGVTVETTPAPRDLTAFADLYKSTMRRLEASDYYFFPAAYWRSLARMGDQLVLVDALLEGEVIASAICLAGGPWLHYHLGAMADRARDVGATNLLLYEAARRAQEQGSAIFHLGGSAGTGEDSLFAFKRRFSPDDLFEYWIGKIVHDEGAYRRLTGGAEIDFEGFFPAYRVPGALSQTAGTPKRM
jgi:serine/alanine adding enzyme